MLPEGTSAIAFILDKPLNQLTEDDIAQVTREDCRRYLKKKGMRRPSWNKSQAIQQVIMLKALLETTPDSASGSGKKLRINGAALESVSRGKSFDVEKSVSGGEKAEHREQDLDNPDCCGGFSGSHDEESAQIRTTGTKNTPVGQMTIFYCGKVNVYDDVPADKAQALLQIAADPLKFPEKQLVEDTKPVQHLPYISKAFGTKAHPDSVAIVLPTLQTVNMSGKSLVPGEEEESNTPHEETPPSVEEPSTRKASVQRYLEKRKDRFKSKGKAGVITCSNLDIHFNYQMSNQMLRTNRFPPPQIRTSPTLACCSSAGNDSVKNFCLTTSISNQGL